MTTLRCLVGHRWVAMTRDGGIAGLDCRECARCHRFEVYAYGGFHYVSPKQRAAVASFRDAVRKAQP